MHFELCFNCTTTNSVLFQCLQGNSEWKKLRYGPPVFFKPLQELFEGVAVDGSTGYIPGAPERDDSSNDCSGFVFGNESEEQETEYGEEEQIFEVPQSTSPRTSSGHKRTHNQTTTAKSPVKKSKSPIVSCINTFLQSNVRVTEDRNVLL